MINSLILGLLVCAFLIITQNIILKIYKYFPQHGVGIIYGSLGVKLIFVCGITIALRGQIENPSLYAIMILWGVLYANVKTVIDLHLKNEDKKKETT
jgi:4-hydroxybenzoate polyprenyltransferase